MMMNMNMEYNGHESPMWYRTCPEQTADSIVWPTNQSAQSRIVCQARLSLLTTGYKYHITCESSWEMAMSPITCSLPL